MRIVVVGGSGNVGSALMRRLSGETLVGVSRRVPDLPPAPQGPDWYGVDIGQPGCVPELAAAFTGADAVVHLAWLIQPGHDEAQLHRTNVDGARHVIEAVLAAGVPHLVVSSSVGAYRRGRKDTTVDESWPTDGIATSSYSRHKVEVERLLDGTEQDHPDLLISRVRPGLVFQREAGSQIVRYFLGRLVPSRILGRLHLPVLPLPGELVFQAVHADDLAAAFELILRSRTAGAFNVAVDPPLTPQDLVHALGAGRRLPLPLPVLRAVAQLTWRAHLQPTDAGWLDLAAGVPIMATDRIRALGWSPTHSGQEALAELIEGMREGSGADAYPTLRQRGNA